MKTPKTLSHQTPTGLGYGEATSKPLPLRRSFKTALVLFIVCIFTSLCSVAQEAQSRAANGKASFWVYDYVESYDFNKSDGKAHVFTDYSLKGKRRTLKMDADCKLVYEVDSDGKMFGPQMTNLKSIHTITPQAFPHSEFKKCLDLDVMGMIFGYGASYIFVMADNGDVLLLNTTVKDKDAVDHYRLVNLYYE